MLGTYSHEDGYTVILDAFSEGITPQPVLTVSEWAGRHRRLSTKESSKPGKWRNDLVPFATEIMDVLSPEHPAQRIVFKKPTQSAGTEVGNNWVGSVIATQHCPMMVTQPTIQLAERWSKQRLAPMIEATEVLSSKIAPARSRDSGNTTLLKSWPGGVLIISGANSAASLRSMPAKYLFADEVDAYPLDLDGEGDPLSLAEARLSNFEERKIFINSTPTIESLSVIEKEYKASDQRQYHVPCPHCGEYQVLTWDQLYWPEGEPARAAYLCIECGTDITEGHKTGMLAAGKWVPTNQEGWNPQNPTHGAIGFHLNALYSPVGLGLTWGQLAADWDRKRKDPILAKTFINTKLGLSTEDPQEKLDQDDIKARAEPWKLRTIPDGCLVLTAGVDVQGDRWAVLVLGHGREGTLWVIDYTEIDGDPSRPAEWRKLDDYLLDPIENSHGLPMRIVSACIDSGYLQDEAINFTRTRERRGVHAIKGSSQRDKPLIGRPTKVDYTIRGTVVKNGAKQWQIGEDTGKHWLFQVLKEDWEAVDVKQRRIHFPADLDESFYSMLTAEVYDPNKRRWIKIRLRNEALDCFVYAMAAAAHPRLRLPRWSKAKWDSVERAIQPKDKNATGGGQGKQQAPSAPQTSPESFRAL